MQIVASLGEHIHRAAIPNDLEVAMSDLEARLPV